MCIFMSYLFKIDIDIEIIIRNSKPLHTIFVNPNTTLHEDEAISHKKCTINAIQCTFGRKYGSYSISGSGVMKNHLHIWHTCIWTHICTKLSHFCFIIS